MQPQPDRIESIQVALDSLGLEIRAVAPMSLDCPYTLKVYGDRIGAAICTVPTIPGSNHKRPAKGVPRAANFSGTCWRCSEPSPALPRCSLCCVSLLVRRWHLCVFDRKREECVVWLSCGCALISCGRRTGPGHGKWHLPIHWRRASPTANFTLSFTLERHLVSAVVRRGVYGMRRSAARYRNGALDVTLGTRRYCLRMPLTTAAYPCSR